MNVRLQELTAHLQELVSASDSRVDKVTQDNASLKQLLATKQSEVKCVLRFFLLFFSLSAALSFFNLCFYLNSFLHFSFLMLVTDLTPTVVFSSFLFMLFCPPDCFVLGGSARVSRGHISLRAAVKGMQRNDRWHHGYFTRHPIGVLFQERTWSLPLVLLMLQKQSHRANGNDLGSLDLCLLLLLNNLTLISACCC